MATAPEHEGRPNHVLAAGGLLERQSEDGVRIVIVHRSRYRDREGGAGDWVLPKGKAEAGETLEEAALREVVEETGCRARIVGPSFCCEYLAHGIPKVTTFFRMVCEEAGDVRDASEVREVVWLEPVRARERLTYETERAVLEQAYRDLLEEKG